MKSKNRRELGKAVVKFVGDSGDGMQLSGTIFTESAAITGYDLTTFPDYPAEIRAPQNTVAGVSGFQIHFGDEKILTSGDLCDVLLAMNPASFKANFKWVKKGAIIIVDSDTFTEKLVEKAGYEINPLVDNRLKDYKIIKAPISSLTKESLKDMDIDNKSALKSKNMFALGIVFYVFDITLVQANKYLAKKFKKKPVIVEINQKVLTAGYNYAHTVEAIGSPIHISPAKIEKGRYRNITGNVATAWGLIAASERSGRPLFLGSYPITPATEILQELALHKSLGVKVFQAEDEIAGITSSIGASFSGLLAATSTSGPGLALKTEAIGLAVMMEIPLVIVDVQRAGPSTGLPTKSEQADLMQALFGRNGECPTIVIAASSPSNCFYYAFEAAKLSLEHMTPVVLLTDGYLGNGSQLFKIPKSSELPSINVPFAKENTDYKPYKRNPETFVREWAVPGMKDLRHRLGGLEKEDVTGNVSTDPDNHQKMVELRAQKVKYVENVIPDQEVFGNKEGKLLLVGWGSTEGSIRMAVKQLQQEGYDVSHAAFNYINPLPKNTKELLAKFDRILVCELNAGQFVNYLRMNFPENQYLQYNKIKGLPFMVSELKEEILNVLEKQS